MKRVHFCLLLLLTIAVSCRKEASQNGNRYLDHVKTILKDSLPAERYEQLDFGGSFLSEVDSIGLYVLRIPLKGKSIENDFVALRTDAEGKVQEGRVVHLEKAAAAQERVAATQFNGTISLRYLNGREIVSSGIKNNFIEAFHPAITLARGETQMAPDLPEVVVVAYVSSGGVSLSDWMLLQSYFYQGGSFNNVGGYYSPTTGSGGTGVVYTSANTSSSSGTPASGGGISPAPVINIDIETYVDHPAIDLSKYLKCFDNIPDAGATCSVEIFADIPVNNDPTKLFNWQTESPGHCFLQIKKSNGVQSVCQNIGFYPATNWKNILNASPVDSKFVDDANHEFDASLKMNITPYQLRILLLSMTNLTSSNLKYDMDEFNCTDFALSVFNSVRLNPLNIVRLDIPGGMAPAGTNTPQGLYLTLNSIKKANGPEAVNITIGNMYNWVGASSGPCN